MPPGEPPDDPDDGDPDKRRRERKIDVSARAYLLSTVLRCVLPRVVTAVT